MGILDGTSWDMNKINGIGLTAEIFIKCSGTNHIL
jgi:hypothetical protein